ncbi:MAG: hypothetical protein ACJASB_000538 [Shewanella psychromarinicola]
MIKEMVAGVGLDKNYDLRLFIYKKLSPTNHQFLEPRPINAINYFNSID